MKSKIYGNKEIIYPEISSEKYKELYEKYISYENSKKVNILVIISNIFHILLSAIYYIGVYGTIFYFIFSFFNKGVEARDLFSILKSFLIFFVFIVYLSIVRENGINFCMVDFFRDIIDAIFRIDIMDELHYCLKKNLEVSKKVERLRNSKQDEVKCITLKDNRGVLVFKIGEEIFNIKNYKSNMDENGVIDYSYLDEDYENYIKKIKKLNKKIDI